MVRIIAFLAGLFFSGLLGYSAIRTGASLITDPPAATAEEEFHLHPKKVSFSSDGILGKFDRAQLQRGFQIYKEVCSSCHGLNRVAFRDLADLGYSEGQIKTIASEWGPQVASINPETGEATTRKPIPADKIPGNYPNEVAARAANNNALPPDLSLITKARHGGAAYVYSLLTGFEDSQPAELVKKFPDSKTGPGLHYNPYFANLNIAMAPPLPKDAEQDKKAKDIAAFLTWTAEPKLEARHKAGLSAMLFLLIFTWLAWMSYKTIWADKKKH
jgi:ubiquinol-cytochrome c reductase cytochrome c1 subunit